MGKFKVGDKVRVRKDLKVGEVYGVMYFTANMSDARGTVLTIKSIEHYSYGVEEAYPSYWTDEMFEGLAEETPREFKVGDRVKLLHARWGRTKVGDLGTIIFFDAEDNTIGIEFDNECGGHDCGCGKDGHCWWVDKTELELVKEAPKSEPTPTPVVNVNVTVNLYENACWYCRKGGLVDLYLAGAMGICPSCGRVCNNTLLTTPKFNNNKHKEVPKAKENKPLTTEELKALPDGTKVFTVWLDERTKEPRPYDNRTCWRKVNHENRHLDRKSGQVSIRNNGKLYHAYLEMPEGYVDNDP